MTWNSYHSLSPQGSSGWLGGPPSHWHSLYQLHVSRVALLIWGRPFLGPWMGQLSSLGSALCGLLSSSRLTCSCITRNCCEMMKEGKQQRKPKCPWPLETMHFLLPHSTDTNRSKAQSSQVRGWRNRLHYVKGGSAKSHGKEGVEKKGWRIGSTQWFYLGTGRNRREMQFGF